MLKIGDVVANYKIVDIRGGMVLGVNPNKECPQPYAFWYLDSDGCGVHWGSYFNCGELATRLFHKLSKRGAKGGEEQCSAEESDTSEKNATGLRKKFPNGST